jgi:hypothetical protein
MGMGYIEPYELGMPRKEFQKLYSEWETRLKESGFNDIEYRSEAHTGFFTPFFRENGSTATFQTLYDPQKQEYFRLATHFNAFMCERVDKAGHTRWSKAFYGAADTYRWLWYYHTEGVPYRSVVKAFSGIANKYTDKLSKLPPHLYTHKSVFWAHDKTQRVLDLFWLWAKAEGFEDPRPSQKRPFKSRKRVAVPSTD